MSIYQEHFGRKFSQCKKTGYWIATSYSKKQTRLRAHQWVWINYHGIIPKGYHIHHRNENKSDNRIENLELILASRHAKHHYSDEKREISRAFMDTIRPLTKEWHRSDEGRAWHRLHAIKNNFGKHVSKEYSCIQCHMSFKSTKLSNTKFCTNACKSKWRRHHKIDHILKICIICSCEYSINKYARTLTCSRKCGGLYKSSLTK